MILESKQLDKDNRFKKFHTQTKRLYKMILAVNSQHSNDQWISLV